MMSPTTPQRVMLPRSETLLSPPAPKRNRVEYSGSSDQQQDELPPMPFPSSLFVPQDLDDAGPCFSSSSLPTWPLPRKISLQPRTLLTDMTGSPLRTTSRTMQLTHSSLSLKFDMDHLERSSDSATGRRLKRRRSSLSLCAPKSLAILDFPSLAGCA